MVDTGTDLRKHREQLGLSQAKLAELTGISQHILSAFELGKSDLPEKARRQLSETFQNSASVSSVVKRRKRYQDHAYVEVPKDSSRLARYNRTSGNAEYVEQMRSLDKKPEENKYSAVSLFSGCGGMSLGFRWAGFSIKAFAEKDEDIRAIYKANFPNTSKLGGDVLEIPDDAIRALYPQVGELDTVIGGPPCQGFSLSGKRDIADPRNSLWTHYLRFVDILRPKIALIENVRLLTSMKNEDGRLVKEDLKSAFEKLGYNVDIFETNAKLYGVPQHRERVFFIGVRKDLGIKPTFPQPTHGEKSGLFDLTASYRTFGDACSDLPFLESGGTSDDPLHAAVSHPNHVINWLWDVAEGRSAHDNDDPSMRPPSGYNTTYKRQVWAEPASTVQTTFGMISGCRNVHPIATRSLTIREAARIQSFPDTFKFMGTQGAIRTALGNAVPPLLAYTVAKHLATKILDLVEIPSF
jgi:DNA (cytosine-5)-methyltransferase 1